MIVIASILLMVAQQPVTPTTVASATGIIRGVVISGVDSSPLEGAHLLIPNDNAVPYSAVATTRGAFAMSGVAPGSYTLIARYIGYPEYRRAISVAGADTLTMTIVMTVHCKFDSMRAMRDISHKRPHILLQGGLAPQARTPSDSIGEKRFGFTYLEFGDMVQDPSECLAQYNRVVFRSLDARFGTQWRDSVRTR